MSYYESKLKARNWSMHMPPPVAKKIMKALKRDVNKFLIPIGLMDYSLILGHKVIPTPDVDKVRGRCFGYS